VSSDTILKAPDGTRYSFDNLASQKWLEGHIPGAEQVEGWLRTEAADRFTAGRDEEAILLRRLADRIRDKIVPEMRRRAEAHTIDHPFELEPTKKRSAG
jgi:hypothetical protein